MVQEFKASYTPKDTERDWTKMRNPFGEVSIDRATNFIKVVSAGMKVSPPPIRWGYPNRGLERPIYRGVYTPQFNQIVMALDYFWKSEDDLFKCLRHEISEWIEYSIFGLRRDRRVFEHHYDRMFNRIQSAVRRYFNYPNKFVTWLKSGKE